MSVRSICDKKGLRFNGAEDISKRGLLVKKKNKGERDERQSA